jgi:predicted transposase/invertase (TIGR01784 family)
MPEYILPPKSNTVFQLLFGDPRNIPLLADFLKAVLDIPEDEYRNIAIVNPYLPREYPDKKLGIVDLRITTRSDQIIHIEIQRKPVPVMRDRLIFYDSSLIAGQINPGEEYKALKRVISILITDYPLITESSLYHHRFTLYDHRAAVEFTNLIEIHTLELTKIPEIPEPPDIYLCNWLRFLRAETKEELDMVANTSPAIKKATAKVLKLSKDERARLIHEYEAKARDYELARLHGAREEGIEEGIEKGEHKKEIAIEIAIAHF